MAGKDKIKGSDNNTASTAAPPDDSTADKDKNDDDDDDRLETIKAQARVFALTGGSSSWNRKRQRGGLQNMQPLPANTNTNSRTTTILEGDYDEDYVKMIQSLGGGGNNLDASLDLSALFDNDDDDDIEFNLDEDDSDDGNVGGDDSSSSGEEEEEILDSSRRTPVIQNSNRHLHSPDAMNLLDSNDNMDDIEEEWMKELYDNPNYFADLEEEMAALLEEDTFAAEGSLLLTKTTANNTNSNMSGGSSNEIDTVETKKDDDKKKSDAEAQKKDNAKATKGDDGIDDEPSATTETKQDTVEPTTKDTIHHHYPVIPKATPAQWDKLQSLLQKHYQGLIQQSILSIRAAQDMKNPNRGRGDAKHAPSFFYSGETDMDLAEVLDLAVNMLQDLEEHRKDAIRTSIQLEALQPSQEEDDDDDDEEIDDDGDNIMASPLQGRRSLLTEFEESNSRNSSSSAVAKNSAEQLLPSSPATRRLTRAAFQRLQEESSDAKGATTTKRRTAFEIPGLAKLRQTFDSIDRSVDSVINKHVGGGAKTASQDDNNDNPDDGNMLKAPSHAQACRSVLKETGARIDESLLPGTADLSENFSSMTDCLNVKEFTPPCTQAQELELRKNRNLFTSAEDNLVLRGVNLYGEKQWLLISDRYIPDRSVNMISQRYSKLCVMLYRARGVEIDDEGNLTEPPKLESVDDIDEERVKAAGLVKVEPPAILNVHRWSLEEDVALLKAVPIMGHMWAELGARLIPHRDRGHLRKRYQVLERRVKATVARDKKKVTKKLAAPSKPKSKPATSTKKPAKATTKPAGKTAAKSSSKKVAAKPAAKSTAGKATPTKKSPAKKTSSGKTLLDLTKAPAPKVTRKSPPKQSTAEFAKQVAAAAAKPPATKQKPLSSQEKPAMSLENAAATLAFAKSGQGYKQGSNRGLGSKPSSAANPYQQHPYYSSFPPQAGATWPYAHPHYQQGAYPYQYPPGTYGYPQYPAAKGTTPAPHDPAAGVARQPYTQPRHEGAKAQPIQANKGPSPTPVLLHKPASTSTSKRASKSSSPTPASLEKAASRDLKMTASKKIASKSNAARKKPPPTTTTKKKSPPASKQVPKKAAQPKARASTASKSSAKSTKSKPQSAAVKGKPHNTLLRQDETSRMAYEKLINGNGEEEWSQMAGVKELMATEKQKAVADESVARPGRDTNTLSHFPSGMEDISNTSNMSGISVSVWNTDSRRAPTEPSGRKKDDTPGMGLMARVLANAGSQSSNPKPSADNTAASTKPAHDDRLSTIQVTTPGRKPSGGSLFSPGFKSPNALLREGAGLNTNLDIPYSPTNSTVMGIFDEEKSNQAGTDTNLMRNILPSDSQLQRDMEGSRGSIINNDTNNMQRQYSDISGVTGVGTNSNSLLIGTDEDYEAVSALEALSNSPFQQKPSSAKKGSPKEDDDSEKPPAAARGKGARQSLFSKVIGGSKKSRDEDDHQDKDDKPPKKKLKF